MSTDTIKPTRSGLNLENLDEVVNAAVSAAHALQGNQQQYETPDWLAQWCARLLPVQPYEAFDPQCANGNLVHAAVGNSIRTKLGVELDNRFRDRSDGVQRVTGNCVLFWDVLEDLYPTLRFPCQVANPPFGIRWKVPGSNKTVDSTEYTWRKIMERATTHGHGFFIANSKTIERLELHKNERVYLYQKFPAGVWKNCEVEIGVLHWAVGHSVISHVAIYDEEDMRRIIDGTWEKSSRVLTADEHVRLNLQYKSNCDQYRPYDPAVPHITEAWNKVREVVTEEQGPAPQWNVYLTPKGKLKLYLSTRVKTRHKLTAADVTRLMRLDGLHPLTLVGETETRDLLQSLVEAGLYTIEPKAQKAILAALQEAAAAATPITPPGDFALVAWADEQRWLEVADHELAGHHHMALSRDRYDTATATYTWNSGFVRNKLQYDKEAEVTVTVKHNCQLSGTDRATVVKDDTGRLHYFLPHTKPSECGLAVSPEQLHEEALLWRIFRRPAVRTVAECYPDKVDLHHHVLDATQMMADFTYYPGQLTFLQRAACRDAALIAGETGTGKSLMALSMIQLKNAHRTLIIAPQGTTRSTGDEDDEEGYEASQWVEEIRDKAPGLAVFELFSHADYLRILERNGGKLPMGVYITYYQAWLQNEGARESCPSGWVDDRLLDWARKRFCSRAEIEAGTGWLAGFEFGDFPCPKACPDDADDPNEGRYWARSVGLEMTYEHGSVRCVAAPSLCTLIGHEFDMALLDEGHAMCKLTSNTTQILLRWNPRFKYIFTATPIPNLVTDIFPLLGWLSHPRWHMGGVRTAAWPYAREEYGAFEKAFLSTERDLTEEANRKKADKDWKGKCERTSPVLSQPARLLKLVSPHVAHISKPMCNPQYTPPTLKDIRVPFGKQQARLYGHYLNRGNIPYASALSRARVQGGTLRNICAAPANFNPTWQHTGPTVSTNLNPKTLAVMRLVFDILSQGEQVLIANSRVDQSHTYAGLLDTCGIPYARIDSTIPPCDHAAQSNKFKRGEVPVMIMGVKCAQAHSYHKVGHMIIGSVEYYPGPLKQALGRIDRVNSLKDRTIYCVLISGSIEEYMFDHCATKDDAASICIQGSRVPREFKPVTMDDILAGCSDIFTGSAVPESKTAADWAALQPQLRALAV